jgi:hypothetical protein
MTEAKILISTATRNSVVTLYNMHHVAVKSVTTSIQNNMANIPCRGEIGGSHNHETSPYLVEPKNSLPNAKMMPETPDPKPL